VKIFSRSRLYNNSKKTPGKTKAGNTTKGEIKEAIINLLVKLICTPVEIPKRITPYQHILTATLSLFV
jgi:hypothetical protein